MKNRNLIMPVFSLMLASICFPILLISGVIEEQIIKNRRVVYPGAGSEGIVLNESTDSAMRRNNLKNYSISKTMGREELFKSVFKIESPLPIRFDSLIYVKDINIIIVNYNNKVNAIIGLDPRRITVDSVDLAKGIDYLIFNYGNDGLIKLQKKENVFYLYPKQGLCLADDHNDGSIDFYIVFASQPVP